MVMHAKYFWELGSCCFLALGVIHLYYTLFTNKFSSENQTLIENMKLSCPIISKQTTMWNAWIGFNASHSIGAIFIGLINIYLTQRYFHYLKSDRLFLLFNISIVLFYALLAKKYWFKIPFIGFLIALLSFIVAYFMLLLNI